MLRWVGQRLRSGTLTLVVVLAALGSAAAVSGANSGSRSPRTCGPQHASTLAASATARVYSVKGIAYGCSTANGRQFRLGKHSRCAVDPVAVAGGLATYGLERCGKHSDNCASQVLVRRLSDGKVLGTFPAFKGPAGTGVTPTSVDSLVLKADGAVAWIATGCSIDAPPHNLQVRRADKGGQALLDQGKANAIDGRSLRLHGAKLTWRHSRANRSASLG